MLSPPYAYRLEPLAPTSLPSWAAERRARLAAVLIAGACVGVRARPEAEAALMLPHDEPTWARQYLRQASTCALFALSVLRLLGAEHEALDQPYVRRLGRAVADVVQIARDARAWRTPEPGALPLAGDVVLVGHALVDGTPDPAWVRGTRATEHVLVVTGLDGDELRSVDGGQPGVERASRRVVWFGRELWLAHLESGTSSDGRPSVARRVVGWLDLAALPLPREAYLPEGADLTG